MSKAILISKFKILFFLILIINTIFKIKIIIYEV